MSKPFPVTPHSATLTLAYLQYYTCKYVSGRCLSPTHLRRLAVWLGCPNGALRSIRRHTPLAAHIALLQAANLLRHNETFWYLTPDAYVWLNQPLTRQAACLLTAIDACQFTAAIKTLNISDTVPLDVRTFIQQRLRRQTRQPPAKPDTAVWQQFTQDAWLLCLPPTLPANILFHLLQLGSWQPGQPLSITPLTIAQAIRRGYSLLYITFLLERTTGQQLPIPQQQQLIAWYRRQDSYRLRPVTLLTTKQPEQLAQIIKNGNLRPHIQEQISPCQAIVSPAIQPSLQKWTSHRGCLLHAPVPSTPAAAITPTGYQWLGLQLLIALGQVIPLSYPPPCAELEALTSHISPKEQARMTALAEQIIINLQTAIRGRDAFFPASQPVPPKRLETIQQAIIRETPLEIEYQALADHKPSPRRIQPLRLEQHGSLHYLHAYCYRAETNLTFRLDRLKTISTPTP